MKNKLLSIAIPTYNNSDFLPALLETVKKSIKNYESKVELLIVDDGSNDGTENIVKDFSNQHEWVRYICKKNNGISASRNTILKNINSKYLWMIDADDLIHDNSVKKIIETLEENKDLEILNFNFTIFNKTINDKLKFNDTNRKLINLEHPSLWSRIWKTDLIKNFEFPVGYIYEDLAIIFNIYAKANKKHILSIKDSLIYYRINRISIMRSLNNKNIFEIHEILKIATENLNVLDEKTLYQIHLIVFHSYYIFHLKTFTYKQQKQEIKKNLKIMKEKFGKKALKIEKGSMSFRVKIGFLFIKFHLFFLYKLLSIFSNRC